MKYKIGYSMAIELLRSYLEKIHALERNKGTSMAKTQHIYELNEELRKLVKQLERNGHNVELITKSIKEKLEQKYDYSKLTLYVDGAARGNDNPSIPNISGIGFAVFGDARLVHKGSKYLGSKVLLPRLRHDSPDTLDEYARATNNTAEYAALIEGLEYLLEYGLNANHIQIFSDSYMVVTQVNRTNSTKAPHLIRLRDCALQLMGEFHDITLSYIPREQNTLADSLVNEMLDKMEVEMNADAI